MPEVMPVDGAPMHLPRNAETVAHDFAQLLRLTRTPGGGPYSNEGAGSAGSGVHTMEPQRPKDHRCRQTQRAKRGGHN
ncbi:MAG: hypothetical protein JWP64_760, partial [Pseudonocardia sp.]|nr:hypothetical protein [Pseudonocardia sp.]MDT7701112.1 hypothetical protein [Pseudonocardiales bacterium]